MKTLFLCDTLGRMFQSRFDFTFVCISIRNLPSLVITFNICVFRLLETLDYKLETLLLRNCDKKHLKLEFNETSEFLCFSEKRRRKTKAKLVISVIS